MTPSLFDLDDEEAEPTEAGPLADLGHGKVPMMARCPRPACRRPLRLLVPVTRSGEPVARGRDGILASFYAWTYNDDSAATVTACRGCGRRLRSFERVAGTYSEARRCDARCTSAKGPRCECQCEGANHGAGWTG